MPGQKRSELDRDLCLRCQENAPIISLRNDPLCKNCFDTYVSAKILKRMERFRLRKGERQQKVLLALSCGTCSTALLHFLSRYLRHQLEQSERTGYNLHVLHVRGVPGRSKDTTETFQSVQAQYPEHSYSQFNFATINLPPGLHETSTQDGGSNNLRADAVNHVDRLTSTSSRTDLSLMLLRKSIAAFATEKGFDAVLFGDTTTTLAARTLAETAKGRGHILPWTNNEGESIHGISFHFPLRELSSPNVASYLIHQEHKIKGLSFDGGIKVAVSTKNTSIDELTKQYFMGVEKEYPAIVTNVVRTTEKLRRDNAIRLAETCCELCAMPLSDRAPPRSRLCYACIKTFTIPAD